MWEVFCVPCASKAGAQPVQIHATKIMANAKRPFPRFLFSDPQNMKSKGPFIVHTLQPFFVVRVAKTPNWDPGKTTHNGKYILFFDDDLEITDAIRSVTDRMFEWIDLQVKSGAIQIPDPEFRRLGEEYIKEARRDPNQFDNELPSKKL